MPTTKTKQTASAVKDAKITPVVIEFNRRQGVYTSTLQIDDVEQVQEILNQFERNDGIQAKMGARAVEIEFTAKGGRSQRDYCLRLPNLNIEDLKKIGFTKDPNLKDFYTSK